ncbi:MAG: GNAT family N-acetyltransferase [Lentisphaeria bacterium]|nr:GNAT family N-acetyltransferase [Lentisphaeria bacterium]
MFEHIRIEKASNPAELLRLAGTVGWNQTLSDCEELILRRDAVCFFALDGDQVIGSAAAKFYGGKQMGYINMVIVLEPYRGHHIATRMLRTLMDYLKDFKTLRLYATEAGSHVYSKLGFSTYAMMHKYFRPWQKAALSPRIRPLMEQDLPSAVNLDAAAFGVERKNMLTYFYTRNPGLCFKLTRQDGGLSGFVIGREGTSNRHAADVIADNETDAFELFEAVAQAGKPAGRTMMILPETQRTIVRMALDRGFELGTPLVCMDYGIPGPKPGAHYYGMLGGDFG